MGRFMNGILVGLGVSLLVAPRTGKEMRDLIAERITSLRGAPQQNEELRQSVDAMSNRVQSVQEMADQGAQMGANAQSYSQQAASSAASVQNDTSNLARQRGTEAPQTTQGGSDTNASQSSQSGSSVNTPQTRQGGTGSSNAQQGRQSSAGTTRPNRPQP